MVKGTSGTDGASLCTHRTVRVASGKLPILPRRVGPDSTRADLNLPADPLLAEEDAAFQNYPTGRAMPPIQHRLVSVARATTLSPYAHGQNAARRGKHVQACPFDTGTVEWRQWRDGFRAVFGRTE